MKKISLLLLILLLAATWMVAQQSYPEGNTAEQEQNSATQSNSSPSGESIRGCLSGSSGSYTLTSDDGKTYQLQGDESQFSEYVGHEVSVIGSPSGSGASASASGGAGANTGSAQNLLQVTDVKDISNSCSPAGAGMGTAMQESQQATAAGGTAGAVASNPTVNEGAQSSGNIGTNTSEQPISGKTGDQAAGSATTTESAGQTTPGYQTEAGMNQQPGMHTESSGNPASAVPPAGPGTPPNQAQAGQTPEEAARNASAVQQSEIGSGGQTLGTETSSQQASSSQNSSQQAAGNQPSSAAPSEQEQTTNQPTGQNLPQTASPLPLLALLGFGSLGASWIFRRK
jgi:hypothetical protein